jgi:hypothetical protein
MGRPLTPDELRVLQGIAIAIDDIITRAPNPAALAATGVLPGANVGQQALFHQRFTQLRNRLDQLIQNNNVVVENLPATMGANSAAGFQDDGTPIVELQLRDTTLVMDSVEDLTDRAITIMHELSHCLYEAPAFPVKDYGYRKAWGLGGLTPAAAVHNADTYAAAAATLAQGMPGGAGRFAELGRLHGQRNALGAWANPALNVGPALAWADIKANRAWLRAEDYVGVAKYVTGNLHWDAEVQRWQNHHPDKYRLLELEDLLRDRFEVVGSRWGLQKGLSTGHHKTVANLTAFTAGIKDRLSGLSPVLVQAGTHVIYDAANKELQIPHALANLQAVQLGERIFNVLADAGTFPDQTDPSHAKLVANGRAIADTLVDFDRAQEKAMVDSVRTTLAAVPATQPTAAQWAAAAVELDISALEGIAALSHSTTLGLPHLSLPALETFADHPASLLPVIPIFVRFRQRLGAQEQHRRITATTSLIASLQAFSNHASAKFPATTPQYTQMINTLQPHTV